MGPWESVAAHEQKGAVRCGRVLHQRRENRRRGPGADLKRLANLRENPFAALVVDPYDEDRTRIGWVMVQGRA